MASKHFEGTLVEPIGEAASNDKLRFTHTSTTGQTIGGAQSVVKIDLNGDYSFDLEYGIIQVEYYSETANKWRIVGSVIVNSDTTVTTITGLLNAMTPTTPAIVLELQQILSDAEQAALDTQQSAINAAQSATESAASAVLSAENAAENGEVIKSLLIAQGLSGNYGFFADGFTYNLVGDVGIDTDGKIYTYAGSDPLPVDVTAGTNPVGDSDYKPLKFTKSVCFETFSETLTSNEITAQIEKISTANHSIEGDNGGADYVKDGTTGTPSTGDEFKFYDKLGRGWVIRNSHIKSAMFGNEPTKIQAALNAAAGGKVTLEPTTYLTNDLEILIPARTRLDLNGATFNFEKTGTSRGFVLNGDSAEIYKGSIRVTGTPTGGGGASGSCVSAGSQGTGDSFKGLKIHDLDVDTVRSNGNGIVLFGDARKCNITNISWPDSATMGRVVATEWGGNDALTKHPHDNVIKNISGGKLTGGLLNSFVVWLSSTFNTELSNVYSPDCYGLVGVFTGDKSNEHADVDYKDFVGRGIAVSNVSGKTRQYGVRVYGKGSDVVEPLNEKPILDNINIEGTGTSDSEFGILVELTSGVVINNPTLRKLGTGLLTGQGVSSVIVNGGELSYNRRNGVKFGNISGVSDCHINGTKVHHNNQAGGVGVSSASGIALAYAKQCSVTRCSFGLDGEVDETQLYSVFVEPNCENCDISDNHTYELSSGGTAYVNGSSTDYDMNTTGKNNTVKTGLTLSGGAPLMTYTNLGRKFFMLAGSDNEPTAGTWQQGDRFEYSAPLVSGGTEHFIGKVYSGGAWRFYGKIV